MCLKEKMYEYVDFQLALDRSQYYNTRLDSVEWTEFLDQLSDY
jgi:superoxide dismutase